MPTLGFQPSRESVCLIACNYLQIGRGWGNTACVLSLPWFVTSESPLSKSEQHGRCVAKPTQNCGIKPLGNECACSKLEHILLSSTWPWMHASANSEFWFFFFNLSVALNWIVSGSWIFMGFDRCTCITNKLLGHRSMWKALTKPKL